MALAVQHHEISDAERHRLEEELEIQLIPGTEVMADLGILSLVKSRGQQGDVLVPQPTDSPHDPLNWNSRWRASTVLMAVLYTLIQPQSQVAIGPIFPVLIEEFNITIAKCSNFVGVTILVLGFSNFLWVPLAESCGRRMVFIGSLLVSMAACIWHATAKSYHSYLGSCVLDGIGSGPEETLFPMIVADVVFLKERGSYVTLYMAALFTALFLSPVACSAMAQNVGWRYFFWLQVALRGALAILAIFCLPETKWSRGRREQLDSGQSVRNTTTTGHVQPNPVNNLDSTGARKGNAEFARIQSSTETEERQTQDSPADTDGHYFRLGRPAKYQFQPFATSAHRDSLWLSLIRDFLVPFKIFFFPIVAFGGFSFAWAASVYGYINFDQSQLLAAPPYNFTILQVGYSNFACFVGAMFGLFTAGPFSDWVSMRATRRNGGIREPEMRLPALIPYLVLMVVGEVVASVGADNLWSWKPIIIIGYFCAGLQAASIPGIAMTYATDSYKPVTGQVFLAATIVKNVWGYGVSQFLNNWNEEVGYVKTTMMNMSLFLLFTGVGGACLYKWGKKVRGWTRNDQVHRMH